RRKGADLWRGTARVVDQQRTDGRGIRVSVEYVRESRDGFRFDARIVVQKQNVLGIGSTPSEIESLGQAEIFRQPDELRVGELVIEPRRSIGGTVIYDDHLEALALPRRFDGLKARTQEIGAVA